MRVRLLLGLALFSLFATGSAQILDSRLDDFQDGTTQSWAGGANPTNVPNGGPAGTGDMFLQLTTGAGGHLASYNITRWTGNYPAVGVDRVDVDLKYLDGPQLFIRCILFGTDGSRWSSKQVATLPVGSAWTHMSYDLIESNFVRTVGTATFAATIASVDRIMFRQETVISSTGDPFFSGSVGIDNVKAVPSKAFDFVLNKTQVAGQNSVKGTVSLVNASPASTVFTTFDNSSLVNTPASVTIPANTLFKDFQITVTAVISTINTAVSAKLGAVTKTQPLTLVPLVPTALAFTPNPVVGGNTVSCRVVINGVAGPGGRTVAVFDNSTYTTMPSTVVVPAGATQVFFDISTTHPATAQTVTVTARVSAGEKTANFRINP